MRPYDTCEFWLHGALRTRCTSTGKLDQGSGTRYCSSAADRWVLCMEVDVSDLYELIDYRYIEHPVQLVAANAVSVCGAPNLIGCMDLAFADKTTVEREAFQGAR